jgi:DNA-binding transcriptional MerR regulator/methylmalonyl-CoA mutase cobalamin-binding subunit
MSGYKMSTIAKMSGFSPDVLRKWESRYSLLEPVRSPGGHRMYTEEDVTVLRSVRKLIDEGRSIGEIARIGRESLLGETDFVSASTDELVSVIASSACELDSPVLERAVDEAFARLSPDRAIQDVVLPACREIGERWMDGRCSISGEHLASTVFHRYLARLIGAARTVNQEAPRVIVACIEGEEHVLGAMVVSYHLSRLGMQVEYLGADLPLEDLGRMVDRNPPQAVVFSGSGWTIDAAMPRVEQFGRLCRGRVRCLIGGRDVGSRVEALRGCGIEVWPEDRSIFEMRPAHVLFSRD